MRGAQTRVELESGGVVLPQGTQILGEPQKALARVLLSPMTEVRIRRLEPAGPGAQVHQQAHANHLHEGRDTIAHQSDQPPLRQANDAAGIHIPEDRQQTHRGDKEERVPLNAHGGTGAHTGRHTPQPQAHTRTPRHRRELPPVLPGSLRNIAGQYAPGVDAVQEQAHEGRQNPEHLEDIKQREARLNQHEAVHSGQQRRNGRNRYRTEEQPRCVGNQRHRKRTDDGRRDAPTEGIIIAKDRHAGGNHPLTQRRMHHVLRRVRQDTRWVPRNEGGVRVLRPTQFVAVVNVGVGILRVVGFVEDDSVRVGQVVEAQHTGQQHNQRGSHPAPARGPDVGDSEGIEQGIQAVASCADGGLARLGRGLGGGELRYLHPSILNG